MEKLLLTIPEAAAILGIGRTKTYELIHTGKLPVKRIGRSVRVDRGDLKAFVASLPADDY